MDLSSSSISSSAEHSESEVEPSPEKKKDKKNNSKVHKNKIIINISDCQYPVVSKVAKQFKWKLQSSSEAIDWDVCWTDNAVQPETLTKMELHQKINHFPGMYNLARKNLLGRGLMKMRKQFGNDYNFFPMTWMLPVEYHELKAYYDTKAKGKARTFIVKPECLSQGKGIFLTRKLQNIDGSAHCVVQRYLHKPYLIDGLKFDLRIYVLIASVDPLTIYLYEEGLGRFATEKYQAPNRENMDEVCMHLTNYAINKDNPKFVFNQSEKDMSQGHKRSLTSVLDLLQKQGVDTTKLMQKIKDSIIKTMISGLPHLTNTYKSCQPENYSANMCFELLGFDVMLNDKCEPIVLEINHTPSFTTDTPLDHHIKFNYIRDALNLMNVCEKQKNEIIKQQKQACQLRVITGKKVKLTLEERQAKKSALIGKKLHFQLKHAGKFERIYPLTALPADQIDPYQKYIDYVHQLYQILTGAKKTVRKVQKEETPKIVPKLIPKIKKSNISTTPDLLNRKCIGDRKYESKKSIDARQKSQQKSSVVEVESNTLDGINEVCFIKTPPTFPQTYDFMTPTFDANFSNQVTHVDVSKNNHFRKLTQTGDKLQCKDRNGVRSSYKEKSSNLIIVDIPTNKYFASKEKTFKNNGLVNAFQPANQYNQSQRDKVPINLNTLLINGIEQTTNQFPLNNLKRFLINQKTRPE